MAGFGMGLRYRPVPAVALEGSIDWLSGSDYLGDARSETAFTLDTKFFLNPRSRFQLYLLTGLGWSGAKGRKGYDYTSYNATYRGIDFKNYGYFNGFAGGGAEWRIARHFAMNADVRGFLRGRVDSRSAYDYEFVSATKGGTNVSGGAIFTVGMTFYF